MHPEAVKKFAGSIKNTPQGSINAEQPLRRKLPVGRNATSDIKPDWNHAGANRQLSINLKIGTANRVSIDGSRTENTENGCGEIFDIKKVVAFQMLI